MPDVRLGVDVGGTFTDFVAFDPESGSFSVGKTLTTPQDLALGIIQGTRETAERSGFAVSDISQVTYGTTLVANLLLQRKGVRVGLIATEGFRDVLETGTEQRYDMYDLTARRAEPLVPRNLRRTVAERMSWDGQVLLPLDPSSLDPIVSTFEDYGVETIAVALMHSYRNPSHERTIREYLTQRYPQYSVSLSSEVAPEVREYPRTSTTVANAYVEPPLRKHLGYGTRVEVPRLRRCHLHDALRRWGNYAGSGTFVPRAARRVRSSGRGDGSGLLWRSPRIRGPTVVRYGRHYGKALPHHKRPAVSHVRVRGGAGASLQERERTHSQGPGDRHDRDRSGRREHSLRGPLGADEGGAPERRRGPGAGMLRARRDRTDRQRRRPCAGSS